MYTIYRIENGGLKIIPRITGGLENIWIKTESPTADELAELRSLIHIPEEVIRDTQDTNEVPKLDTIDGVPFILIQTPVAHEEKTKGKYAGHSVVPLGVLLHDSVILTITWHENDVSRYLDEKLKNISQNYIIDTTKTSELLIKLFLFTAKAYLRDLKDIHQRLHIPDSVTRADFDKDIIDLLFIEKSLVYFNASLRSNDVVLEKISKRKQFVQGTTIKEVLDDARDEMWQAIEVAKVYGRIVEDLRSALSSLISNDLTRKVNWLTKITVILMIPTLVGTFYGMNVALPIASNPAAFWILIIISIILAIVCILWLRYRAD